MQKTIQWSMVLVVAGAVALMAAGCVSDPNPKSAQNRNARGYHAPTPTDPSKFDVAVEPDINSNTRFAAGRLAESQGDYERAIAQYIEVLRIEPMRTDALYHLAVLQANLKRYEEAIGAWQTYIDLTGRNANSYNNLALTEEAAGRLAEAERDYLAGIQADQKNVACHVNYGLMLARQKRTADAEAQLSMVLKPEEVRYNLASVYESQGDTEAARQEYIRALQINPRFGDAQQRLASLGTE